MKDTKPIRLNQELMASASKAAEEANRTPAEQIEHWALLGMAANQTISREDMLDVLLGIAKLKVEVTSD